MKKRMIIFVFFLVFSLLIFIITSCGPTKEQAYKSFKESKENLVMPEEEEKVREPEEVEIVVEGYGLTKEEAEADARVKALQTVVGMKVFGHTKTVNYSLVDYTVITKTLGYIRRSEILDVRENKGLVIVKAKYYVSKEIPDEDYIYIISKMKKPRIGFLIKTYMNGEEVEDKTVEITLIGVFKIYEFDLYDTQRVKEIVTAEVEDPNELMKKLAKLTDIDVLVWGEVKGERAGEIAGLLSSRAKVDFKIYWVHTGRLIGAVTKEEGASDISYEVAIKKAIEFASREAADSLVKEIVKEWMDYVANGLPLDVVFKGIDYDEYLNLKFELSKKFEISSSRYSEDTGSFTISIMIPVDEFYIRFLKPVIGNKFKVREQFLTRLVLEHK